MTRNNTAETFEFIIKDYFSASRSLLLTNLAYFPWVVRHTFRPVRA